MSINQNFPEIRPSLNLNFARSKTLDPRITFTRASTATYVDEDGLIKTAVADEARFDHDPATGESLGLLIEEERTNNMLYSGTTAQMVTSLPTTRTSGGFAAPDGSTDASRVDLPAVTAANVVRVITEQFTSLSGSTNHTASVYLKGVNGGELVYLTLQPGAPTYSVAANLTTEWQRFDISGVSSSSGGLYFNIGVDTRVGTGQTNQPAQSFLVWGAQLEAGSFPTSYIPTSGSSETREPDTAKITGTNFTDFYNQSEGTVFVDADKSEQQYGGAVWFNNNETINRGWSIANSGIITLTSYYRGDDNALKSLAFGVANLSNKTAVSFKSDSFDFAGSMNGSAITTNTLTSIFTLNAMRIGYQFAAGGGKYLNNHISRLTYYSERLINAQLQTLTK